MPANEDGGIADRRLRVLRRAAFQEIRDSGGEQLRVAARDRNLTFRHDVEA